MYTPDYWLILKILGKDPHYKVFGSWSGSYLCGQSWRMNSGIESVTEHLGWYDIIGSSGSVYRCNDTRYGANSYGSDVVTDFVNRANGKIEILETMPDMLNMNWILSITKENTNES